MVDFGSGAAVRNIWYWGTLFRLNPMQFNGGRPTSDDVSSVCTFGHVWMPTGCLNHGQCRHQHPWTIQASMPGHANDFVDNSQFLWQCLQSLELDDGS